MFYRYLSCMVMLMLASCVRQGPTDLTLQHVFLSDWSSDLKNSRSVARTAYAQKGLVLELTSAESFAPFGAGIEENFCGGDLLLAGLGSAGLFVPAGIYLPERLGQPAEQAGTKSRYTFYILIPETADRARYNPLHRMPYDPPDSFDFDLESDNRDICLRTKFMREDYVWLQSNEIRVPRRIIDQAFRAGLKPLPAMKPL